ncbi:putative zinc finger protein At1g68190 isoform X1 [Cajanus cajan]|uniref:Zinc finger protein At1g68190 family n=1 Tax=Cajanus cajan TaxID=3821 RepID=A0A151U709_CAJCA|nr:putative zinc finger protein At1g68190 isoform X1 [Cajanus cajan]XP_020224379.1 putative zinc finger protein At1g68190 isoform X1 [Cajanus cajan]XP_020224387.1 putative zinc finger protein At1g68190 isoform X1 [Cajanus cajan]KYP75116.1 Putative zinc finger protein At1g68190 family [Cajanus cajan]
MEKVCEFCTALRPLVYCKADAAYLCLSCDAKVHLANALSGRHLRNLVCNSCGYHLAYVLCLDHKMLICRDCDQKLHNVSLPHQKRAIRSFMGCPSAKDFAALWGLELNEIENCSSQDQFDSVSCVSADMNVAQFSGKPATKTGVPSMKSRAKLDGGSAGQQGQILYSDQERQTIVQQIIDLKWLQLNEGIDYSAKINRLQEKKLSPSVYHTLKKLDEKFNEQAQNPQDLATNVLENECSIAQLNPETLPSTFSQLDNLSSSAIVDLPLHGELFWTCKSPLRSNQLWSQNIQDLGICEELVWQDDFNIPDVDLSFQNFEELFGVDQDPVSILLDDQDVSCSSLEKDKSVDKSDIENPNTMEDSSAAAFITVSQSDNENKDMNHLNQYCPRSMDTIQPFSVLRFNAESSCTDHDDSALSPYSEGKAYSSS